MKFLSADDHSIVRLGLRLLIENGWPHAMIEEADGGNAVWEKAKNGRYDMIILDFQMPDTEIKKAPIRLLVFDNRVEIISPGKLPNSLTVEDIKYGNPVIRNNQLVAFSIHTLPFSGLGSGIPRSLEKQPNIEFTNDIDGEQFIVTIPRPEKKK